MRLIVAVYGRAKTAPLDDASRNEYCSFVRDLLVRYPAIRDVVIWNEPNLSFFWQPQFNPDGTSASPAAYEALLARCWDVLHAEESSVNVIAPATAPHGNDNPNAPSNISHSPGSFIRKLGDAYRSSGRGQRIFDTVAHHVYGNSFAERPWKMHTGPSIGEGDWNKLMAALSDGFAGTAQAIPGECFGGGCVAIWYLEAGFETTIDEAKASLYTGTEAAPQPIPDDVGGEPEEPTPSAVSPAPDQSTQIRYALRLAYCQPYVEAFFNFLIWDQPNLAAWQTAPFWSDRTPKDSYPAFAQAVAAVNGRTITCAPPTPPAEPVAVAGRAPTSVGVTWGASSSKIGVSAYRLYRDGAFLVNTSALGYVDKDVRGATTYSYTVRAYDAAGQTSDASNAVQATTPALLTVSMAGNGRGTVSSDAAVGIDCGSSCSGYADPGSTVTLTANPSPGSLFVAWSGACAGAGACTITMDADKAVTATFWRPPSPHELTVVVSGRGRVSSLPTGIDCAARCASVYPEGTTVVLAATPARRHGFARWGGACSGVRPTSPCTVLVDEDQAVEARFAANCVVADVRRRTIARAKRMLARDHCATGRIRRAYARGVRRGRVVSQRQRPGTELPNGAPVDLLVSRGRLRLR